MKKLILFSLIITWANISDGQKTKEVDHYKTDDFDVAIFAKDAGGRVIDPVNTTLKIRYTPTRMEIKRCEDSLVREVIGSYTWLDSIGKKVQYFTTFKRDTTLAKYKRQYFGFIDSNDDKILVINAFKMPMGIDWLKNAVAYSDADDAWVLEFNLSNGKLFDIMFGTTIE